MRLTGCRLEKAGYALAALKRLRLPVDVMKINSRQKNIEILEEKGLLDERNVRLVNHISKDSEHKLWLDTIDDIDQPRHLYRALLRECSYIPDVVCKSHIKSYILSRFRDGQIASQNLRARDSRESLQKNVREKAHDEGRSAVRAGNLVSGTGPWAMRRLKLLKDARRALKLLQDSNRGISEALTRVLFFAYGRIGRRRHELLEPLRFRVDGEPDFMSEMARSAGLHEELASDLPSIPPKLEALFRSHKANRIAKANIKSLQVKVPKKNSWSRAMPQNRTKNELIEWFAKLMSKVCPPLPEEEWERIGKFATGEMKFEVPVIRRSRAQRMPSWFPVEPSTSDEDEDLYDSSDTAKFADELQNQELKEALKRSGYTSKRRPKQAAHNYTPRFMRRRYTELFELCPKLLWDGDIKQWRYEWGQIARRKGNSKRAASESGGEAFKIRMTDAIELDEAEQKLDNALHMGNKAHLYGSVPLD